MDWWISSKLDNLRYTSVEAHPLKSGEVWTKPFGTVYVSHPLGELNMINASFLRKKSQLPETC